MNGGDTPASPRGTPAADPRPFHPTPNVRLRIFDIQLHRFCDGLSGWLLQFLLIATPWAFGTTQPAVIWTMNGVGYTLGGLLLIKEFLRRVRGYQPPRWSAESRPGLRWLKCTLAVLTCAIVAYCLTSALNARFTWQPDTNTLAEHPFIKWLPHSNDRTSTWSLFWNYLALACVFWSLRSWLLGLTRSEEGAERRHARGAALARGGDASLFPGRLRQLLWVLCVNGALLGLEGIIQRVSGSTKLLWLVQPRVNPEGLSQFGPYAYRSNAAQYFNLLWPVCLGFWWTLHRTGGFKRWRHHLLLPCGIIMAACPVIATTRAGAFVTGGLIACTALFLVLAPVFLVSGRRLTPRATLLTVGVIAAFFISASWLALHFGWEALELRMSGDQLEEGYQGREQIYATARRMAAEYPLFGTGPGSFNVLFQYYRASLDEYWPAQLHNDWLETLITFGWLGSTMIWLALLIVLARWFVAGGIHGGRRFVVLVWLALAGALVHARFDFPFQIYSILLLFLTHCAVLFTLSRRGGD